MAGSRSNDFSVQGILGQLTNNLSLSLNRPSIHNYIPHEKQIKFHSSDKIGRLYIGGNRSGKTVGGIVEDVWWLTGRHPYLDTPKPPVRGRIVTVDYENGWELIIKPELQRWLPATELINGSWEDSWREKVHILTLANGSQLDIMSYQQNTDKQAGTSRHFIHFDEEPPSTLYNENRMRLLDVGGRFWFTMTPVEGMTWTYDQLYEPSIEGNNKLLDVIEVDMEDNPYLSQTTISAYLDGMDEDEKKARKSGKYVQIGGLIYKSFDYKTHVIPEIIPPRDWTWVRSLDHGFNNHTAWLYHAISPSGIAITFHEHYFREKTIAEHAEALHEYDRLFQKVPDRSVGDPAIRQRMANSGKSVLREYAELGIPIHPANNDVKIGLDQGNFRLRGGKWFITENCRNLLWELKRYKWKVRANKKLQEIHGRYDEPHKKDDHAMDSARYFFVTYRVPAIEGVDPRIQQIRENVMSILRPTEPANPFARRIDTGLKFRGGVVLGRHDAEEFDPDFQRINTEWSGVSDENMGGFF